MELPVHDPRDAAIRPTEDIRAMAIAVQANLVQLKVSEAKRRGLAPEQHEIQVPSPGTVRRYRETLIDHRTLATYSDQEVHLRLHEVWGQFCLLRWLFSGSGDLGTEMHCHAALDAKHAELHALLWRIRFEQRRRDTTADTSHKSKRVVLSQRDELLAAQIPAIVFGKTMDQASDEELLLGACQHAGMLAALRWTLDSHRPWADPGIMDVHDDPFAP